MKHAALISLHVSCEMEAIIHGGMVGLHLRLEDHALQELMAKYEAVNKAAWQAFGAIQALLSREAVLKDLTLNELQSLFRCEECQA